MVPMIATSDLEYPPGRYLKPGDPFEAEDGHDKLFTNLGRARLTTDKDRVSMTSAQKTEEPKTEEAKTDPAPKGDATITLRKRKQNTDGLT